MKKNPMMNANFSQKIIPFKFHHSAIWFLKLWKRMAIMSKTNKTKARITDDETKREATLYTANYSESGNDEV